MTIGRRIADLFVAPAGEPRDDSGPDRRAPAEPRDDGRRNRRAPAEPRDDGRRNRRARAEAGFGAAARGATADRRPPPAVAVLAPPADAPALAAALGLALARSHRSPAAVLCVWSPDSARGWRAPAMPAAARLAATLTARGHDATAAGRLVLARLGASPDEAAGQALRIGAAAGAAPVVVALAGPRVSAFDELLALQDLVVVGVAVGADPALARLATAGLERAVTCDVPPADPGRILAGAGLGLLPSTRRAVAAPVDALSS